MSPELLSLLLAALLIFSLRILDVTLGTLRITYLVRGRRSVAGLLGFFEALVWLTAAAQVLGSLDSPVKFVAYAAGYAAGTMLGVSVERWIAAGDSLLRVVSKVDAPPLEGALRAAGYFVTSVNGQGRDGDVRVLFTVLPRRKVPEALKVVRRVNPAAYVTVESTSPARDAQLPALRPRK